MTGSWQSFNWTSTEVPHHPPSERERAEYGIPLTLRPVPGPEAPQRSVFDPALKQHPNAYRAADPAFRDPALAKAWLRARRRAMDLVLAAIADSPWVDDLVLRGSVLLRAWFGEQAREPGDLDFVVVPAGRGIEDPRSAAMLDGIAAAAQLTAEQDDRGVRFDAREAVAEDIWTYERVPGRRLVLPWTAEGLPGGVVQLDFVFNEPLPVPPEPTAVPGLERRRSPVLNAATPELSLAWKVMWLLTDRYGQGKDLRDAVLLAEHGPLRPEVLREVFAEGEGYYALHPPGAAALRRAVAGVEWKHFVTEYPAFADREAEHGQRLLTALAPTFAGLPDLPEEDRAHLRRWLAAWVERYREPFARDGFDALQEALARRLGHYPAAVVITRELLGPDRHGLTETEQLLRAHPAWSGWHGYYQRNPGRLAEDLAPCDW
ncbi:nucleotidyl transferase AbiEii/AbiGii toxin family protein [Kitasatospora albolonga]|uniref:nucleotidyl transferase AbiEii/AbiGii toxin family protein n=1 Tax=Kitasatospora albolonga TaxID=68173 RepID=UPI0031EC7515